MRRNTGFGVRALVASARRGEMLQTAAEQFRTMLEDDLAMPFKTDVLGMEAIIDITDVGRIVAACARTGQVPPAGTDYRAVVFRPAPGGLSMDPYLPPVGVRAVAVARWQIEIDRDKLRAALRRLPDEYLRYMLDDAIEQLPSATLRAIVSKYLDVRQLRPDSEQARKASLLAEVTAFETASLAGDYYEAFDVDSKNFMEKSRGTTGWIAECRRLLDRCVAEAKTADPAEVCQAFGIIFGLLDRIDEGQEDIVFFADEAGAWQVGVDWEKVLPPWFRVLSATAGSEEYGQRIVGLLKHHYGHGSARMLALARRVATPQQRQVFPQAEAPATRRRTPSRAHASPARSRPPTGPRRTER